MTWKSQSQATFPVNSRPHSSTFRYQDLLRRGGTWGNVQTRGGNSLLGCSTSVALTMGPPDEEEGVKGDMRLRRQDHCIPLLRDVQCVHMYIIKFHAMCSTEKQECPVSNRRRIPLYFDMSSN